MPRRISAALVLVSLLAAAACGKKKPSNPDTPAPAPTPATTFTPNQNPQVEPGMPYPPTQRPMFAPGVLSAAQRDGSRENLKQIGIAFHNFHDQWKGFPVGVADKNGKVGLSWRVAILPYIEQGALYNQFKLDEPWNSEHNKKLVAQMPTIYAPPRTPTNGYTFYRSFSGNGAVMTPSGDKTNPGQPVVGAKVFAITDGSSNTLMVAEAYDPVIWTKPDDLPFVPGKPPRLGGGLFGTGFNAAFCDGSVRFLPMDLGPQDLSNLIQTNDGKVVNIP